MIEYGQQSYIVVHPRTGGGFEVVKEPVETFDEAMEIAADFKFQWPKVRTYIATINVRVDVDRPPVKPVALTRRQSGRRYF